MHFCWSFLGDVMAVKGLILLVGRSRSKSRRHGARRLQWKARSPAPLSSVQRFPRSSGLCIPDKNLDKSLGCCIKGGSQCGRHYAERAHAVKWAMITVASQFNALCKSPLVFFPFFFFPSSLSPLVVFFKKESKKTIIIVESHRALPQMGPRRVHFILKLQKTKTKKAKNKQRKKLTINSKTDNINIYKFGIRYQTSPPPLFHTHTHTHMHTCPNVDTHIHVFFFLNILLFIRAPELSENRGGRPRTYQAWWFLWTWNTKTKKILASFRAQELYEHGA